MSTPYTPNMEQVPSSSSADARPAQTPGAPEVTVPASKPPARKPNPGPRNAKPFKRPPFPRDHSKEAPPTKVRKIEDIDPVTPIVPFYQVKWGPEGIETMATYFLAHLRGRDPRLADAVTLPMMQYVVFFLAYVRCAATRSHAGVGFTYGLDMLVQVAQSVHVPTFFMKYVECFGVVSLSNGCSVVPTLPDDETIKEYTNRLFEEAGRRPPQDRFDLDWIVDYNNAIGRARKIGIPITPASFTAPYTGRQEFLCSYESDSMRHGTIRIRAMTPEQMPQDTASLGALYRLRRAKEADGVVQTLFEGRFFVEEIFLQEILNAVIPKMN